MKNQLVRSIPLSTSSITPTLLFDNSINNDINNNNMISFMDDGFASCSLEGNIGVDNFISLHDFFQHLSQVPLGHATATSPPPPLQTTAPPRAGYCHLEERHNKPIHHVVAQGFQTMEQQVKGVVKPHSKGKQPLNPERIHMPHQDDEYVQNDPLRGPQKFRDIDVDVVKAIKGHSKGKQPPESKQAEDQYAGSSKRNSQTRSSEHKRRERINAKMRAMQALVPTCDKGDHASILDRTIKYIKSMKLQIDQQMMSRSIGQSLLQNLYAPQMMMQPTMVPRLGYGTWPSHMSPSGYTYMVTPPGDGGVPIQPVPQIQAQAQTPTPTPTPGTFASILCPLQYLSTTISTPATPTVMSFVPPLPQLTPSNNSSDASHNQPPNS